MRLIDADALKARKVYSRDLAENVVPTACIDWAETIDAAPRWHSMEDNGPPEENGPYFVYAPSYRGGSSSGKESARGVMISKWTGKHWSIEVGYYKRPGCVTHWMPIEPPKEDA